MILVELEPKTVVKLDLGHVFWFEEEFFERAMRSPDPPYDGSSRRRRYWKKATER